MPLSTETADVSSGPAPPRQAPAPVRGLGVLLLGGGLIGLAAAVALLVEKIALIENPDYIPTCSINPVLSCGSVMTTPQAEAFGIPNPIIGIVGFTAVAMVGAAVLAGAEFRRWFWFSVHAGAIFAVVFVHWLIYQSLYVIGALCPYCMVVWAVTIPIFLYTTAHMLRRVQGSGPARARRVVDVVYEYRAAILTAWYLAIIALIGHRFWDYWITLI